MAPYREVCVNKGTTAVSPLKKTLPRRALNALTPRGLERLKDRLLQRKYRRHAFDKTLDWGWGSAQYNRIALVNLLVAQKSDCAYLEIGCATNALFSSIPIGNKTGVDPERGGNVRMTSDEFFTRNSSRFDIIFIDGLHTYEQVRRDVLNSIKVLKPGGWIALHDMLPSAWIEHHSPVITRGAWTGDVWKVAFELSRTRGIDFKIVQIDYGVGVFRLTDQHPELVDMRRELADEGFGYFYENVHRLPVVDWVGAQNWLRSDTGSE